MGGAAEWVERYSGGGQPGVRTATGCAREDARLAEKEERCVSEDRVELRVGGVGRGMRRE